MNLSGYTISRRLARGGQAVVYEAVQTSLGRRVALKLLDPLLAETEEFTRRFLDEGRILANLRHANAIVIHDVGVEGDLHYITMELAEGGDLKKRIRAGLEPESALGFLAALADCLACAHTQHIVHRDIKPGNVLFRQDGTLLLTDFGIAKRLDAGDWTVSGTTLGSPSYLSPEQVACRTLDGRADIYSLGAMTFEMLTGSRPYVGSSDFETMRMHLSAPVPKLPAELARYQDLIDRMMAKSPDDRFEDAPALIAAVRALQPGPRVQGAIGRHDGANAATTGTLRHAAAPARSGPHGGGGRRDDRTLVGPATGAVDGEVTIMNPALAGESDRSPATRRPMAGVKVAVACGVLVAGGAWLSLAGDEAAGPAPAREPPPGVGAAAAKTAGLPLTTVPARASDTTPDTGADPAPAQEPASGMGAAAAKAAGNPLKPVPARPSETTPASVPSSFTAAADAQAMPAPELSANISAAAVDDAAGARAQPGAPGAGSPATSAGARTVEELLARARQALDELRLTTPEGDSALDYYRQVLAIDPRNRESLDGHAAIAERYVGLARTAARRGDNGRARRLVARGLAVAPDFPELLALQSRLAAPPARAGDARSTPVARDESIPGIQGEPPQALLRRVRSWFQ